MSKQKVSSVELAIGAIDWEQLRRQKLALLEVINDLNENGVDTTEEGNELDGLVHLIDAIQDKAAEEIGKEEVFGVLSAD